MKVRDKKQTWTGWASNYNVHGIGEVIVGFDSEGGMDSMFIHELEVFLPAKNEWVDMSTAFRNKDLISDNLNTCFREPANEAERTRGYY